MAILPSSLTMPPPARAFSSLRVLTSPEQFLFPTMLTIPSPSPSPSRLTVRMGGGPRTFPGGVSKWQWKRMQAKKAKQLLKARLCRERQIYEMRKRAELKAAVSELEKPWEVVETVAPTLFSVKADEQVKVLADRFQKPGGFDLWSEKDGPQIFRPHDGLPSARFFPKGVIHSVKPYGAIAGCSEESEDRKESLQFDDWIARGKGRTRRSSSNRRGRMGDLISGSNVAAEGGSFDSNSKNAGISRDQMLWEEDNVDGDFIRGRYLNLLDSKASSSFVNKEGSDNRIGRRNISGENFREGFSQPGGEEEDNVGGFIRGRNLNRLHSKALTGFINKEGSDNGIERRNISGENFREGFPRGGGRAKPSPSNSNSRKSWGGRHSNRSEYTHGSGYSNSEEEEAGMGVGKVERWRRSTRDQMLWEKNNVDGDFIRRRNSNLFDSKASSGVVNKEGNGNRVGRRNISGDYFRGGVSQGGGRTKPSPSYGNSRKSWGGKHSNRSEDTHGYGHSNSVEDGMVFGRVERWGRRSTRGGSNNQDKKIPGHGFNNGGNHWSYHANNSQVGDEAAASRRSSRWGDGDEAAAARRSSKWGDSDEAAAAQRSSRWGDDAGSEAKLRHHHRRSM